MAFCSHTSLSFLQFSTGQVYIGGKNAQKSVNDFYI